MPNHWESSARPLFVRTVFVNGHRHALLFEEDPLLQYGNSSYKKISRSSSSLSFTSDLSLTSSDSQDSNLGEVVGKLRNDEQRQRKDLSSELQSCLVKFRLASANLENGTKPDQEKCFCHSEENKKEISKQKKYKCKRDKSCRRKHCSCFQGESKENKLIAKNANKNSSSCYFYNYEGGQRKKNYCVVKISSQPPKLMLSCRCDGDMNGIHKCKGIPTDKSKMVISATIHNLFMTTKKEHLFDDKVNNSFLCENIDSIDLYWNNYLTRSCYNSLSDRVFQWLDLANKRKNQKQKLDATQEDNSPNTTERIFSGKTFVGESKKTEYTDSGMDKQHDKVAVMTENETEETPTGEVGAEVLGEDTKLVLSSEKSPDSRGSFEKETSSKTPLKSLAECHRESVTVSVSDETKSNCSSEFALKSSRVPIKTPLKIHDLFLDYDFRGNLDVLFEERKGRKTRGTRDSSAFRSKRRQVKELFSTEEEDEDNVIGTPLNYRGKKSDRKTHLHDIRGEQTPCHCNANFDEFTDKINRELPTERFPERNQKSINNLNITRAQTVLLQNLLPPRQDDEISSLRTEKAVWGSEKDGKRPQLHIFMPSLLLKDTSDDSMSECENVVNLC